MAWLREIPQAVVAAHLEMLPRLQAEEALAAATAGSIARGLEPSREQLAAWQRAARGGQREPVQKATAADLRALGIGVRTQRG